MAKNPPANAGDPGLVLGSGRDLRGDRAWSYRVSLAMGRTLAFSLRETEQGYEQRRATGCLGLL